ncbi:DUF378 domain-containing protein [Ornithinibacillus sp. 4-3]|uniref:DUF378 domain-containing protein n=1 Tax=Ornithinibacillus sp. 4-3 TaxID=3231488 RepID=A0AB39HNX5_9BACI
MHVLRIIVLTLIIIGALNWGLIGFFNYDLVAALFGGDQSAISRVIYSLVGLSGLYALSFYFTDIDDRRTETDNLNYQTESSEEFNIRNDHRDRDPQDRY